MEAEPSNARSCGKTNGDVNCEFATRAVPTIASTVKKRRLSRPEVAGARADVPIADKDMTKGTITTEYLKSHTAQHRWICQAIYQTRNQKYRRRASRRWQKRRQTISNCDRKPQVLRTMSAARRIPASSTGSGIGSPCCQAHGRSGNIVRTRCAEQGRADAR